MNSGFVKLCLLVIAFAVVRGCYHVSTIARHVVPEAYKEVGDGDL